MSLRHFGGYLSKQKVYCVCPRLHYAISNEGKSILKSLDVEYIEKDLNQHYSSYPLANKPIVCEYIESIDHSSDYLLFLDSDTLIVNPIDDILKHNADIALSPVLVKNLGLENKEDPNYNFWHHILNDFKVKNPIHTNTLIHDTKIVGYWNSGVILINNNQGIFSDWLDTFKKLYAADYIPQNRRYHIEQLSLSITVHKNEYKFQELDKRFNYHISNHKDLNEKYQLNDYMDISILHYHKLLEFSSFTFPFPKLNLYSNFKKQISPLLHELQLFPLSPFLQLKHFFGNLYYNLFK